MTRPASPSRRRFLAQAAALGFAAPCFIRNLRAAPPSETVRHASFGAGGMAHADLSAIAGHKNVQLTAVADVDLARCEQVKKEHPGVKIYQDWRELLDKEEKNLDSVNVSTPDHMHAPIGMSAMQRGPRRLRAEAAHARRLRIAPADGSRPREEARHADGHSGPFQRRIPHGGRARAGGSDRPGQGGAHLEQQEVGRPGPAPRSRGSGARLAQLGFCGWASSASGPSSAAATTIPATGASGSTSAPARSATWAAISTTRSSRPWP